MSRIEITEAELLADFEEALAGTDKEDGHTVQEIREVVGWGEERIRRSIKKLVAIGSWEHVKVARVVMNGTTRLLDAYRPVVPSD